MRTSNLNDFQLVIERSDQSASVEENEVVAMARVWLPLFQAAGILKQW